MRRASPPDKSFAYVALLEALGKSGCPVCRLLEEASLRCLDALFYEQITDVGTRRKLRSARGLCNWHTWQARQISGSALGLAIIATDLLREEMARLHALLRTLPVEPLRSHARDRIPHATLRAFLRGWRQKGRCPACQTVVAHEQYALETLLNFLGDPEFVHRFDASTGLCLPHLIRAAEVGSYHPQFRRLVESQCRTYARLVGELEEFCRKHDYRYSHTPWGAEADAWLRASECLAGKAGIFGNDIPLQGPEHQVTRWWRRLIDRCLRYIRGSMPLSLATGQQAKGGACSPASPQHSTPEPESRP